MSTLADLKEQAHAALLKNIIKMAPDTGARTACVPSPRRTPWCRTRTSLTAAVPRKVGRSFR